MRGLVWLSLCVSGILSAAGPAKGKAPAPTPKGIDSLLASHLSYFGPSPKDSPKSSPKKGGPKKAGAPKAAPKAGPGAPAAPAPDDYDYDYSGSTTEGGLPKCICYRKWSPVCGAVSTQGQPPVMLTFPNECEANCHTKNVTPGVCLGDSETFQKCYYENCDPDDVNPVCIYQTDFPNPCTANCQFAVIGQPAVPLNEMAAGPCLTECDQRKDACPKDRVCWPRPGKCFHPPCATFNCLDPTCSNPNKCGVNKFAFVCAAGVTFTNKCWANCEGYTDTRDGVCPPDYRDPFFPRVIPHDPVTYGFPDPLAKVVMVNSTQVVNSQPVVVVDAVLRCLPGLYLSKNTCLPCPAGTFSQASANSCRPCAPGTFAAMQASSVCTPCPRGSFSNTNASNSCATCPPPLVTTREGSTRCETPSNGDGPSCDANSACECAEYAGDCGWSSTFNKCMKDKDTDCKECGSMTVCREGVNASDPSLTPSSVRHVAATEIDPDVIKLQWVAPIRNFVCNTDLYQLSLRKQGGTWQLVEWPSLGVFGLDPVVSVGGLTPDTEYTVQVFAVSLVGGKSPSVEVTVRTSRR